MGWFKLLSKCFYDVIFFIEAMCQLFLNRKTPVIWPSSSICWVIARLLSANPIFMVEGPCLGWFMDIAVIFNILWRIGYIFMRKRF